MKTKQTIVCGFFAVIFTLVFTVCDSDNGTKTYTVTFSINGGSGTAPAAQTASLGSSITLPSGSGLSKSGYTFSGWNNNSSGTGTNYDAFSSYTVTGDVTLYARWKFNAPTGVNATAESSSSITVSWTAISNASGYYVYRSSSAADTYTKVGTTSDTSYMDTGLSVGTTYYYKVSAYNSDGESPQSLAASATTAYMDLSGTVTISPSGMVSPGTQLTASYSGNETVSYLWERNNNNIIGANSNEYTPNVVGDYTVTVAADGYNSITSSIVIVTNFVPGTYSSGSGDLLKTTIVFNNNGSCKITQQVASGGTIGTTTGNYSYTISGGNTISIVGTNLTFTIINSTTINVGGRLLTRS